MALDRSRTALSQALRSSGQVRQGRFKIYPVQRDQHLLMVLRHVLQNPAIFRFSVTWILQHVAQDH